MGGGGRRGWWGEGVAGGRRGLSEVVGGRRRTGVPRVQP